MKSETMSKNVGNAAYIGELHYDELKDLFTRGNVILGGCVAVGKSFMADKLKGDISNLIVYDPPFDNEAPIIEGKSPILAIVQAQTLDDIPQNFSDEYGLDIHEIAEKFKYVALMTDHHHFEVTYTDLISE